MTWKVREEGSPRVREGLSLEQVVEGLEEGEWGPTDEVRGPDDRDWTLREPPEVRPRRRPGAVAEPRGRRDAHRHDADHRRGDGAAGLLHSDFHYSVLEKRLEAAEAGCRAGRHYARSGEEPDDQGDGHPRERSHGLQRRRRPETEPADQLGAVLGRFVRSTSHTTLLLVVADDVPYGDMVFVEDQAKGAGMYKVMLAGLENKAP